MSIIKKFKITNDNFKILGRTKFINEIRYINYSCSGIEFEFTGTKVTATLCTNYFDYEDIFKACVGVFINDEEIPSKRFSLTENEKVYTLYESTKLEKVKIRLVKLSECAFAKVGIKDIEITDFKEISKTNDKSKKIEFIGDSITCGYGIEGKLDEGVFNTSEENPWNAYAAKTARYFDADYNLVAWSGIGIVSSWTESGDANTDWLMPMLYKYTDADMDKILGKSKEDYELWDNKRFVPDLIVINLGTNDFSYTKEIPERIEEFKEGYFNFLKQVRNANPDSQILCTYGVMNNELYCAISETITEFNHEYKNSKISFMKLDLQLESDGLATDSHPSLITHSKMYHKLTKYIEDLMNW